jgi:hypothetical protein
MLDRINLDDAIKFCYQMIREGAWEKNISKIEHYTKLVGEYTDEKLKQNHPI